MKTKLKIALSAFGMAFLVACGGEDKSVPQYSTQEGVNQIIAELNEEFGADCAFTNLNLVYDASTGTMVVASGSNNFTDNKMETKTRSMGSWTTTEEVTLDIEGDATMRDFMFSIDEMNFKSLSNLTTDAVKRVSEEHANMETEFMVQSVFINAPDEIEGDLTVNYQIEVEPVTGGSSFMCEYTAAGDFVEMRD